MVTPYGQKKIQSIEKKDTIYNDKYENTRIYKKSYKIHKK